MKRNNCIHKKKIPYKIPSRKETHDHDQEKTYKTKPTGSREKKKHRIYDKKILKEKLLGKRNTQSR
jgi:hypothetical protein